MASQTESYWPVAADDGFLQENENQTLESLYYLESALKWLSLKKPPYEYLEPSQPLQDIPALPLEFIARESEALLGLHQRIGELENALATRYNSAELGEYGTVTYHLGRRNFYRGFIEKRRNVPLLRNSSSEVIFFLEKIPKFGDYVKRENHSHFGIHYHYLDWSKRRSDTVLCFEPVGPWPLFAEKHAERSAHFPARPRAWSEDRRRAVYDVLNSEIGRFKPEEFRSASRGSVLVWQKNANILRHTKNHGLEIVLHDKNVVSV